MGLAWAGTKKRTREHGARVRALHRLVERAGEAWGTCRLEPREWRAGDRAEEAALSSGFPDCVGPGSSVSAEAGPPRPLAGAPVAVAEEAPAPRRCPKGLPGTRFLFGWFQPARGQNTRARGGRARSPPRPRASGAVSLSPEQLGHGFKR